MHLLSLTPLERAALSAIFEETGPAANKFYHLFDATVATRDISGGGFFTTLNAWLPESDKSLHLGTDVYIAVEGLTHGIGMILHLYYEPLPLLEGYPIGGGNLPRFDQETLRFAVVRKPGPLPVDRDKSCGGR